MKGIPSQTPRSFVGRLRVAAAQRHLRQVDIARKCDVTRAAVSGWFNGKEPSSVNLMRLADVLAVRHEWLMAYDNGPAHRAALALEVTKKVTYDAGKRVPPLPMSAEQLATDGALMSIYEKLLRLAQDWLALPEKDREQWSRTMRREAAKHRAPSGDPADADATPKINLPLPRTPKHHSNNSAGPIGTNQKRRHAKKRNGQ